MRVPRGGGAFIGMITVMGTSPKKQAREYFPRPDSLTARGVHPAVLVSYRYGGCPCQTCRPSRSPRPCVFTYMGSHLPVPPLSGFFFHNRDVSICLIGYHFPAWHKTGQDRGFGSALCRERETVTFVGAWARHLSARSIAVRLHDEFLVVATAFRDCVSEFSQRVGASDNGTNCEVFLQFEHL